MPVQFQFVDNNGTAHLLREVDDEICEFVGIEPSPDHWCKYYQVVTWIGLSAAWTNSRVTRESLDKYFEEVPPEDDKTREVAYEFLVNRYTFRAWR